MLVPLVAVWGLVWGLRTLASNYKQPRNGVPRYFNHWSYLPNVIAQMLSSGVEGVSRLPLNYLPPL